MINLHHVGERDKEYRAQAQMPVGITCRVYLDRAIAINGEDARPIDPLK